MAARSVFNIRDDAPAAIGLGLLKNVRPFDVFGVRSGLTADVEEDISRLAAAVIPLPSNAGQQLEVVSTDPTDTQLIEFETLGPGAVNLPRFRVNLNGTTPVLLPEALVSRINEVENVDLTPFLGTVNIQAQGGGTIFGLMRPQDQQMNQAMFTVRSDKKWLIKKLIGTLQRSTGTENDVTLSILFKQFDGTAWRRPFSFGLQRSGSSSIAFDNSYPNVTDGPVDIKMTARSTVAGATASAWINGLLL
jgi:hypothetical protein